MSNHVDMVCGTCGIEYCMPEILHRERLNDHKLFYCPNGHGRYYSGMSDRKVRDLIKYLRCVYLPSINGNTHTIIFNPSTRFYEYTDDPAKIEMAKAYHKSYANAEWENIQALDITLRKINSKSRQLELL